MENELKKNTIKNMVYAFSAQIISVLLSVLMSLVVPKLLGVEEFSYWQLFLFYITYVGFFHLGITDGMYLKIGGTEYKEVDKGEVSSQFWFLTFIQILLFTLIVIISASIDIVNTRKVILFASAVYMVIANMNWFLGYVFQATNRVKVYSCTVMIDKVLFLVFVGIALIFKINNLILFVGVYLITRFISLIYIMIKAKDIIFTKPKSFAKSLQLVLDSSKIGINLTLASISSILILGIGRFMIDKEWGITSFGKFSFAISLTNFFLLFIQQISIVLFPTLRQVDKNKGKELYEKMSNILNVILPSIYVLYIPIKVILGFWLPQYKESLEYLAILLPLCIFDGKMQMISNTYFKVLREERKLLIVNVISLLLSTIFSYLGVYIIRNIYAVIIGLILAIAVRSIISEIYLSKKLNTDLKKEIKDIFIVVIISVLFVFYNILLSRGWSLIFMIVSYIVLLLLYRNSYIIIFLKNKINSLKEK